MKHIVTLLLLSALAIPACDCSGAAADDDDPRDPTDGGELVDGGDVPDGGVPVSDLLDTAYGENGVLRAQSTWSTDTIYAAARTADGKIVAAGTTSVARSSQLLVGRFTADGAPDATFGSGGHTKIPLFDVGQVTALFVLDDGAILLAGSAYYPRGATSFAARLTAQGALDPTFGDAGLVLWEAPVRAEVEVAAGVDGRARVASAESSNGARLQCLDVDGSLETERELDGDVPRALVVLGDGKLLALSADSNVSFLQRLNADCSPDGTFAGGGSVELDFVAYDLAVEPEGADVLVTGERLVKLTANGVIDESFVSAAGGREVAWLPSGEIFLVVAEGNSFTDLRYQSLIRLDAAGAPLAFDDSATAIFTDRPARLVAGADGVFVAGSREISTDTPAREDRRMSVLSLTADGTPSAAYGSTGLAELTSMGACEAAWDMARQPDGSIVVAATAGAHGALVRFVDGELDLSFGVDGFVRNYFSFVFALRAQSDGGLVGLGTGGVLTRFLPDGARDDAFVPDVLPGQIEQLTVAADGRILAAGAVYSGFDVRVMVARILDDGTLDASFGVGGLAPIFEGENAWASSIFEDADGAIVISGEYFPAGEIFCARLTPDGQIDGTFGDNGITRLGGQINDLSRIVARRAGGYLIATRSTLGTLIHVSAVGADGAVIDTFGVDGLASVAADGDGPFDLLELEDGRVLLAKSVAGPRAVEIAVWALRADGQPDVTFGEDGRFVLPGQGHAVRLLPDGDGVLVGGYHFQPATGADVALVRIKP